MSGKTVRILEAGEIERRSSLEIPPIRLPRRSGLFADRARRLRQLAEGHAMGDYLGMVADIAEIQQQALDGFGGPGLPAPEAIALCAEHGMPPLNVQTHRRHPEWRDMLRRMAREFGARREGVPASVAAGLERQGDDYLEAQASKLLAGLAFGVDPASAPLIGAALQVYFAGLAAELGEGAVRPLDVKNLCPACGSTPMASVIRIGGAENGHRYLCCGLCSTEWHMVRIKCSNCETDSAEKLSYRSVAEGSQAVQAESCEACGSYLKLFNLEKDPNLDPVADDLATMVLDLLMADTGLLRNGRNLMLLQGDAGD